LGCVVSQHAILWAHIKNNKKKRLLNVSISLTSGIRVNGGVGYGGMAHAQTKVPGVRTKKCVKCEHG